MFYNFSFFAKPSMDFIQMWRDDRALSKILCSIIPIAVHDLKIKVTDLEFFCVKSLQCQLLQSLWLIWIMFGMNGYKILKCFRKEKRVSGELPCPATGLIMHPTSKDLKGHIAFGLCIHPCICPSICLSHFLIHAISYKPFMLGFGNFIYGFLMKK